MLCLGRYEFKKEYRHLRRCRILPVTKNGFSFDFRYANTTPEFDSFNGSVLSDMNQNSFGFSKYFYDNALKLQTSYSRFDPAVGEPLDQFELILHISL